MTISTYGAFPGGAMSEFNDTSQNAFSPWVVTSLSGFAAGKYKAKFLCNPSTPTLFGDPGFYRVHALGGPAGNFLTQGSIFFRCLSVRWVRTPVTMWAGDEIHASGSGPLANGPAPMNGPWTDSTNGGPMSWNWIIRGGGNVNTGGSYTQVQFGPRGTRWAGLSEAITVNEWLHTMCMYNFSSSAVTGSFEMWACHHGGQMINIVPFRNMATCFPSPITHYPMMSAYHSACGLQHEIEYAAGAYGDNLAALKAFQVAELGYDMWGGAVGSAPTVSSFTPTSGPVGTSVVITGTNFTGTTNVKFNGVDT